MSSNRNGVTLEAALQRTPLRSVERKASMREIGCDNCEAQIQHLTRSRSLTVREREALWRAINIECGTAGCAPKCSTRSLVARVSLNLVSFVERLDRHERQPRTSCDIASVSICQESSI
jgi:hypothetical protein